MEHDPDHREWQTRGALAEWREAGGVRDRQSRMDAAGREEQVQGSSPLCPRGERTHRNPGSRRLGGLPQHKDPAIPVKPRLWLGVTAALVITLLIPAYSAPSRSAVELQP